MTEDSPRKRLERRFAALEKERALWLADCREIADMILPIHGRFLMEKPSEGDKRGRKIINATATLAHRTMAAGLMAGITSPARPWFRLATLNEEAMKTGPGRAWLDAVEKRMRHVMAQSNLYTSLHQVYAEEGAFGTAVMVIVEDQQSIIRAETLTAGEYLLAVGAGGKPAALFREFKMTVGQMVEEFGLEVCSDAVKALWQRGSMDEWRDIRAVIERNLSPEPGKVDSRNKPWRSVYWEKGAAEDRLLRESGYEEQPFMAPRWDVLLGASYGTGPGLLALGDTKALQSLERSKGKGIAKMVDPPMVAPDSLRGSGMSLLPGAVTYITDPNGVVRPAYDINLPINYLGVEIQSAEARIRQAFYADLFLMLSQQEGQMTAREVQERHEEKLLALGPMLNRQHPELLDPLIERIYGIMLRGGLFPPLPEELAGQYIKVQYISVLAQAQEASELTSLERVVGFTGNLAGIDPTVLDNVNLDKAVETYGTVLNVSSDVLRDPKEVAEIRAARQQQQQAQQQAEMLAQGAGIAQQGAAAAKLLSETETGAGQSALQGIMGL